MCINSTAWLEITPIGYKLHGYKLLQLLQLQNADIWWQKVSNKLSL